MTIKSDKIGQSWLLPRILEISWFGCVLGCISKEEAL